MATPPQRTAAQRQAPWDCQGPPLPVRNPQPVFAGNLRPLPNGPHPSTSLAFDNAGLALTPTSLLPNNAWVNYVVVHALPLGSHLFQRYYQREPVLKSPRPGQPTRMSNGLVGRLQPQSKCALLSSTYSYAHDYNRAREHERVDHIPTGSAAKL